MEQRKVIKVQKEEQRCSKYELEHHFICNSVRKRTQTISLTKISDLLIKNYHCTFIKEIY